MAWPLRLRAMSFVIVIGVVLMELAVALIPIGLAVCFFTTINAVRVFADLALIAFVIALAIAVYGDLGRQGYRKWWRLRA